MFQMTQVGRRIVELCRRFDMTQSELADRLGVSFQAVSNWERGNSMPDISKLPELAEIFQVSVDELLGGQAPLLRSAMDQTLERYVEENPVSREELRQSLPLLKPGQVEAIARHGARLDKDSIEEFLPYLDGETVEKLALQAAERGERVDAFLPYMDGDAVERLALDALSRGEDVNVFLPFLEDGALEKLARQKLARGEPIKSLMPFLNEGFLRRLVLGEE